MTYSTRLIDQLHYAQPVLSCPAREGEEHDPACESLMELEVLNPDYEKGKIQILLCRRCGAVYWDLANPNNELGRLREEKEVLNRKLFKAEEWRDSIVGLLKTFPEFDEMEWSGDKKSWGFCFELIKFIHKERKELMDLMGQGEKDG